MAAPSRIPMMPPAPVSSDRLEQELRSDVGVAGTDRFSHADLGWCVSVTEINMMFITPMPPTSSPTELMMLVSTTSAPVNCFQSFERKSGDVISKSFPGCASRAARVASLRSTSSLRRLRIDVLSILRTP